MDYFGAKIEMHKVLLPENVDDETEYIENWLLTNTDFKQSECYYMFCAEPITVKYNY
jgi:hypothetical protein